MNLENKSSEQNADVYLSYCWPLDIVHRLYINSFCYRGNLINIRLEGDEGTFGVLEFWFEDDDPIEWNIYIKHKDKILAAVDNAVLNYISLREGL